MSKESYFKRNLPKIIITSIILAVLIYIAFFWGNTEIKKRLPIKYEAEVKKYSQILDEYSGEGLLKINESMIPILEENSHISKNKRKMAIRESRINHRSNRCFFKKVSCIFVQLLPYDLEILIEFGSFSS